MGRGARANQVHVILLSLIDVILNSHICNFFQKHASKGRLQCIHSIQPVHDIYLPMVV